MMMLILTILMKEMLNLIRNLKDFMESIPEKQNLILSVVQLFNVYYILKYINIIYLLVDIELKLNLLNIT
jgi:hypothetical protein